MQQCWLKEVGRLTVTGFQLAQSDITLMYPEAPAERTAMA